MAELHREAKPYVEGWSFLREAQPVEKKLGPSLRYMPDFPAKPILNTLRLTA